ncbi:methanogenic corrinoid protein MtbC1 [Clostridium beijerinckii]|nr:methanogenic corrinoid protein MtbC1 [Clostridium beijerinckii]NRU85948.1 methanogenic corrinoid protein MtbC1 [Clostridium beijerinckii]
MDSTLWEEVGADKMGKSAADNIDIIEQWMKEDS